MSLFKTYIRLSASLVLVFLASCGGEEPNPCAEETSVTAEFTIKQQLYDVKSLFGIADMFEVDTVLLRFARGIHWAQDVSFITEGNYDSVQWIIGDDPRVFTQPAKTLFFDEPLGKLDVQCIVYKKPNINCFPEDDGVDSLTKSFYLLSTRDFPYPFEGQFEGYNEDEPGKLFTVTIKDMGETPIGGQAGEWYGIRIQGLPEGCGGSEIKLDHFSPNIRSRLYRQFTINSGSSDDCPSIEGFGEITGDRLNINYKYSFPSNPIISKKFIGNRVK